MGLFGYKLTKDTKPNQEEPEEVVTDHTEVTDREFFQEVKNVVNAITGYQKHRLQNENRIAIIERVSFIVVFVVSFIGIIYLAVSGLIDRVVTGTLVGSIIGYALGKNRKADSG